MSSTDTQELRQMMTDKSKVNFRVFVGCIPTDTMQPEELADLFRPFGEVEGVLLNRGFGFVQFTTEQAAKDVVIANGTIAFRGRKVDVKPARPMKRPNEDGSKDPVPNKTIAQDRGREPTRYPNSPGIRFPPPPSHHGPERANDCEIIVVNKAQTEYAEYIEQKLRRLGLTVDLLFPNEDVPVPRVLTNIANRGCLFAVVIMPQNEEHRSITLNILHGPPQEHRNMPLEDAVALVSRSFEAYALREKSKRPLEVPLAKVAGSSAPALDTHPEPIQVMVNLLADNRMLTVLQYDKLIGYLNQRRDAQIKVELGDSAPPSLHTSFSVSNTSSLGLEKQASLQSRILSLLNKPGSVAAPAQVQRVPSPKAQILQDPSVQKALNSIMKGDLLRNFADKR